MQQDIVIGIDSSTQSTKAVAWNAAGIPVAEGRSKIQLFTPRPGWVEQDVEDWWLSCCRALSAVTTSLDPRRIAGLAISNQRETVAFLDDEGKAVRPAIVWLDERAGGEIKPLSERLGPERLHRATGKNPDLTQVIYRLEWLRKNEDTLSRSTKVLDVHSFLSGRLTGRQTASHATADPFGTFDIHTRDWSDFVLDGLEISRDQMADLSLPSQQIGAVTASAAAQTGLLAGTPLFAGAGDGQCAGLGVNAARSGSAYLSLGTAIITGVHSNEPLISRYWNTLTSPTGEGYFLEGAQRAGAFFINWFMDKFLGQQDVETFEQIEREANAISIGSDGLTACTYLNGCMAPHWDPGARAAFIGLSPQHGLNHLYRASLEAMTLEIARCLEAMRGEGLRFSRIMVVGGGSKSTIWPKMIADATGLPLSLSHSAEASSLGAGICAAVGAGWYDGFDAAATAMTRAAVPIMPDGSTYERWSALSRLQSAAYRPSGMGLPG